MNDSATILGIDSHVYLVKDVARATAFWRDTMGLHCTWSSDQGAEFEFPDGTAFGLWRLEDAPWKEGNGLLFAVKEVKAASEALRAKGVTVYDHVEDSPSCFMGFAEDTEGNTFVLHQRKA